MEHKTIKHPHNETLQLIDKKINSLIETMEYISDMNGKGGGSLNEDNKKAYDKIVELTRTKKILFKYFSIPDIPEEKQKANPNFNRFRPVAAYLDDRLIGEYESIKEASEELGVHKNTVRLVAENLQKKSRSGYTFKFI